MTNVSSGQVFDASGNVLSLPFTGTETPAASGIYLFDFWHTSGVGFSADYSEATSSQMLSIENLCTIPTLEVVCPSTNDLGTYNCNTLDDIPTCPTDEATAEVAPYNLTIDDMPCGDIITIEPDIVNPIIDTEAMDLTVECDGAGNTVDLNGWLANNGGSTASDDCSEVIFTNDFTTLSNDCGATGSALITFTATDDCGNTSTSTATFTIEDTTDPMIDTEAMDITIECDGTGNVAELNMWLASNGGAVASDVCSGVIITNNFI